MSFLAPWFLLLAGGVAVPLLIHLLRRRAGRRMDFPAARYLARAEQEHRRTLRLRNLLLMLLRVAAVLLVAMAAARPMGRWLGGGHPPTAIAIVVDNSLSTGVVVGGRPLLDRFRAAASALAAQTTSADRVWLVTADGVVRGGSAATVRAAIDELTPLAGAGDLRAATLRAAALVRGAGLDARQVAVLTDGQASAFDAPIPLDGIGAVVYAPSLPPPANRAVIEATPRPPRWTPRGAVVARIQSRDSAAYRLVLGTRTFARGTAAPGEEVAVPSAPPERGWIAGRVELEPDELAADDVRHFAVWVGPAPGIAVSAGAGEFVRNGIDVLVTGGRVRRGLDVRVGPADEIDALPALIFPPSDPVRLGAANRALDRLGVPWRYGAARRAPASAAVPGLRDIAVQLSYPLESRPGVAGDTLGRLGATPWIVAGRNYVMVGSPLDPAATTLPVRAGFVPWLAEMLVERLGGDVAGVMAALPAARVARPAGVDALERADGTRAPVADSIELPSGSGTHFLLRDGQRVGAIVVNAAAAESRLDRLAPADLAAQFPAGAAVHDTEERWRAAAFASAARRSLLEPILLAAAAMLVLETLILIMQRRSQV